MRTAQTLEPKWLEARRKWSDAQARHGENVGHDSDEAGLCVSCDGSGPAEAAYGRANQKKRVAEQLLTTCPGRQVTPGDLGELLSCPTIASKLFQRLFGSGGLARIRASLADLSHAWTMLSQI